MIADTVPESEEDLAEDTEASETSPKTMIKLKGIFYHFFTFFINIFIFLIFLINLLFFHYFF